MVLPMNALPSPNGPHVACIMDGNGRWAKRRGLPRTVGHTAGEENLAEVRHILSLHKRLFGRVEELNANNVRINWIGRPFDEPGARTPAFVQRAIRQAITDTASNTGMVLTVAFDYGSRAELLRAAQRSIAESDRGEPISPETVQSNLYSPELPDVDLLIRTSGESRISNFLLWQISNAKVYFTERSWPDLDAVEIDAALALIRT
jgi:undecaprenyl diphosphate synthase